MVPTDHHEGDAVALNPQNLTYDPIYRIKGLPDHDEATGWHYIGSLDGVARFSNDREACASVRSGHGGGVE